MDTRSVLRPLRGAGLAAQAGRALGSEPGTSAGGAGQQPLPGAMMPRRLAPINQQLTSIPEERGKGPLSGKPIPKKSASPFEETDGTGGEGPSSAPSPPFETTRPLPPIAGTTRPAPLPPISGSNLPPLSPDLKKLQPAPLPKLTGHRPGIPSMPSRQGPTDDPFSTTDTPQSLSPPAPGGHGAVRLPPTRPTIARAPPTPFASTSPKKEPTLGAAGKGGVASPAKSDAGKSGTTE